MASTSSKRATQKHLKAFDRLEIVTDFDNAETNCHSRPPPGFEHTTRIGMGWRIVSCGTSQGSSCCGLKGALKADNLSRLGSASIRLNGKNRMSFGSTLGVTTASRAEPLQVEPIEENNSSSRTSPGRLVSTANTPVTAGPSRTTRTTRLTQSMTISRFLPTKTN